MALRKFTKEVGRYGKGELHDYPRHTWQKMAQDAGMKLEDFTEDAELDELVSKVKQSSLKKRPTIHKRLGATQ